MSLDIHQSKTIVTVGTIILCFFSATSVFECINCLKSKPGPEGKAVVAIGDVTEELVTALHI